jgi:hypothetical protein
VGETLPAALVVWKLGNRLLSQAGPTRSAQRWARIGAAAAGLAGLSAILVAISNSAAVADQARHDDRRLEDELEDSFPASDPPAITRSGG